MKRTILMLTISILTFTAAASAGQVISLKDIYDGWFNASPTGKIVNSNSTYDYVYWGKVCNLPQGCTTTAEIEDATFANGSSYVWDSIASGSPVTIDSPFIIGDFTHNNFPIYEPVLESVSLYLGFTVGNDALGYKALSYIIDFEHNETPNIADTTPCDYTSTIPCADSVKISNAPFNAEFYLGKDETTQYYFTLLGFSGMGASNAYMQYITQENKSNIVPLYAIISTKPVVPNDENGWWNDLCVKDPSACYEPPDEPNNVPEPGSILLLGTGIIGIGFAARRRLGKK